MARRFKELTKDVEEEKKKKLLEDESEERVRLLVAEAGIKNNKETFKVVADKKDYNEKRIQLLCGLYWATAAGNKHTVRKMMQLGISPFVPGCLRK